MLVLSLVSLVGFLGTVRSDPFADLEYEAALAQAKAQSKLLLVDFTASWCSPCKRMEKDVWPAEEVRAWLGQHAIAIQVDVDEEKELAKRFDIQAMPTVVAIRDGQEFDRITGYRDAPALLGWANEVLAGRRSSDELMARAKELADSKNVMARYDLAQDLTRAKQYDLALTHYLWLWPATRNAMGMAGVRLSFMLGDIAELAEKHAPTRAAFLAILDELQSKLDAPGAPEFHDWMEWSSLCNNFGQSPRVIAWYESKRDEQGRLFAGAQGSGIPPGFLERIRKDVFEALVAAQRYLDAGRLLDDARKYAQETVARFEEIGKWEAALREEQDDLIGDFRRKQLGEDLSAIFTVLVAAEKMPESLEVATLLLATVDTPESRVALVEGGLRVATHAEPCFGRWLDEAEAARDQLKGTPVPPSAADEMRKRMQEHARSALDSRVAVLRMRLAQLPAPAPDTGR